MAAAPPPDPSDAGSAGSLAASLAGATFPTVRKGFDPAAVREVLRRASDELTRAQRDRDRLAREVAELREAARTVEPADLDQATVAAKLGEEAARVLSTAHDAANQIRARADNDAALQLREAAEVSSRQLQDAEETSARLLREADEEASRLRGDAEIEASRRRRETDEQCEAEIEAAKSEGREMVAEARAVRERVFADLTRRRELARHQIENLHAGRRRILESVQGAHRDLGSILAELEDQVPDEDDDELPPLDLPVDTGPVPVAREPQARMVLGEIEVPPNVVALRREPVRAVADLDDEDVEDEDVEDEDVEDEDGPVVEDADVDDLIAQELVEDEAELVEEEAEAEAVKEAERGEEGDLGEATETDESEEVDDPDGPEGDARPAPAGDAAAWPEDPELEAEPESADAEPWSLDPELEAAPHPGEDPLTDELHPEGSAPDVAPAADATTAELPVVGDAERVPAAEAAGDASGSSGETRSVDDLFARLRASGAATVARDVLEPDDAAGGDEAAIGVPRAVVDADDAGEDEDLSDDARAVATRDALLAPLQVKLGRQLKRVLADEQNEVLDRLRQRNASTDPDVVLGTADAHAGTYEEAAEDQLWAAAVAGAHSISAIEGEELHAALEERSVLERCLDAVANELVVPLRARLSESLDASGGDATEAARLLRSTYREWKGKLDELSGDLTRSAYGRAAFAVLAPGTPVCWAVDRSADTPCADAEDNALAGAVPAGEPFPTGHRYAPAYRGCRCLLVLTDK